MDSVRSLLESRSRQAYLDRLISFLPKWSKPFSDWFYTTIHPTIDCIGSWELEPFDLESVTTNCSESFNHVLKELQAWKESPVDVMALALMRLTQFQLAEINRGCRNVGSYTLRQGIEPLAADNQTETPTHPTEIVDTIRRAATASTAPSAADVEPQSPPHPQSQPQSPPLPQSQLPPVPDTSNLSSAERAANIIVNNNISLNHKLSFHCRGYAGASFS